MFIINYKLIVSKIDSRFTICCKYLIFIIFIDLYFIPTFYVEQNGHKIILYIHNF